MMDCKECLNAIVANDGDMEELGNVLCDAVSYLDDNHRKDIESRMYVLAYGEKINQDMAEDAVSDMLPYGEHWTYEQTTSVGNQYGWNDYTKCSFYWAMNMMYNDYHNVLGEDTNLYIKMARAFLNDEDAPSGDAKVYRYIESMK